MNAIPTFALGVQFRSRLEARWAWMFKLIGFAWHYEPLDLRGWIPDFQLEWCPGVEVLVEVKPGSHWDELAHHSARIHRSGWEGHALIVGSTVPLATPTSPANALCIGHLVGGGPAILSGHGKGQLSVGPNAHADADPEVRELLIRHWLRAGNEVQWKKPDRNFGRKPWNPADDADRHIPSVEETAVLLAKIRSERGAT
jgi:hypothetical protein